MTPRRAFLTRCSALVGVAALRPSVGAAESDDAAPVLNDDGLYAQPWFLESFLDLTEDLSEAAAGGKRFAIMWEQKGCPYCQETHLVNFAQPEIQDFVRANFEILQLNLFGSRAAPDVAPTNPRYGIAVKVWKKLPLSVTRLVGPWIMRSLP